MMTGSNAIAEETDSSRLGLKQAGDGLQQRTLSGTVRADKSHSLSGADDKRRIRESRRSRLLIANCHTLKIDCRATCLRIFVTASSIRQPWVDMMRMLRDSE
jgi:hypothetical protein